MDTATTIEGVRDTALAKAVKRNLLLQQKICLICSKHLEFKNSLELYVIAGNCNILLFLSNDPIHQ